MVALTSLTLLGGANVAPLKAEMSFASKEAAFRHGYGAYKGRHYEIAVPALAFAARKGVLRARFFLAKIYSDNSSGWTDHARAYNLLRAIVQQHSRIDPKDFRVAPIVSHALTSIARYERDGITKLGLEPNTQRALQFFKHAARYFDNEDAQFELAKHYLAGDGVEVRVPYALNWLAKLSKRGHAGAQAFLANLYWDGRYTQRDPVRALALIAVAVENATEEDRFWIEDVHQNIFCDADKGTRQRVQRVVAGWRKKFGRSPASRSLDGLASLSGGARRICANGDVVDKLTGGAVVLRSEIIEAKTPKASSPEKTGDRGGVMLSTVKPNGVNRDGLTRGFIMQGSIDQGFSLRPTGQKMPAPSGPVVPNR